MEQPELGQKIIELRKYKGLTQEELVEKCNINVRTLQRIESGEVNPRSFTIKMIFNALDYDINSESLSQRHHLLTYFKGSIDKLNKHIQNLGLMKNSKNFFYNYFLATGIVWFFLCTFNCVIQIKFSD